MALATVPVALAAFGGHFHDMLLPNGHMALVAAFQNNYFPPKYLGFPDVPLRYHYGFDLFCAGLTALTRLRKDLAIDLTTIFGWAYSWCLAWVLGMRLTGSESGGPWTALTTIFGGSAVLLFGAFEPALSWSDRALGKFTFDTHVLVSA